MKIYIWHDKGTGGERAWEAIVIASSAEEAIRLLRREHPRYADAARGAYLLEAFGISENVAPRVVLCGLVMPGTTYYGTDDPQGIT